MKVIAYVWGTFLVFISLFDGIPLSEHKMDCETLYSSSIDKMVMDQTAFMEKYIKGGEGYYERDYNFEKGILKIKKKSDGLVVVEIDFIHVGHFDANNGMWHWAWEDGKTNSKYADSYKKVRQYGLENGCDRLHKETWKGKELNAWEMTAATNHILKGKGAARHYTSSEYNYVVFMEMR